MMIKNIKVVLCVFILILAKSLGLDIKFGLPQQFRELNESVFIRFDQITSKYSPIPLGSGHPDFKPPKTLRQALVDATWGDYSMSQYVDFNGIPRLLNILAKFHTKITNRDLTADNFLVTAGCTEALLITFMTFTKPGDEWIIFSPFFENYEYDVRAAQGVPKFIHLKVAPGKDGSRSNDYIFDKAELQRAFNYKTKGVVINSPMNPLGKIFTREELEFIADLCKRYDAMVVFDEVYEFLIFDNNTFPRMIDIPGMFERTVSMGSGGKVFSSTGYRIGWAYGTNENINQIKYFHQIVLRSLPKNIQEGFATVLENEYKTFGQLQSYTKQLKILAETNRNFLVKLLKSVHFSPIIPDGGYFLVANFTNFIQESAYMNEDGDTKDFKFCVWMIKNIKVGCLPLSGFYNSDNKEMGKNSVRFVLIKKYGTMTKSKHALENWKSKNTDEVVNIEYL